MNRRDLLGKIEQRLGDRQLVWFGTRGDDVEPATELHALSASFSLIGAYGRRSAVRGVALEDLTGVRMDLDTFDLDEHPRDQAMVVLRQALLRTLARPSALFAYRPSAFVSAVCFARKDRCQYLGLFGGHQSAFEHKPWVESAIADLGVPHVPWTYIADDDRIEAARFLRDGPIILRRSRTTGGVGLARLDDEGRLGELWPDEDEAFVSVAPFITDAIPVNVGGVVWRDGGITVHPASVQLIGIPGCTERPFGYCGNDFGAFADLGQHTAGAIDQAVVKIGGWLHSVGYLGAFGVDFLVKDGVPLFTEVNPRFQGSTHLSCQICVEQDESCLLTEHIGAFLGLAAPARRPLWDWASVPPVAHFVVHSSALTPVHVDPSRLVDDAIALGRLSRVDVLTHRGLITNPGGTIARLTVRDRLTHSGYAIAEPFRALVTGWSRELREHAMDDQSAEQVPPRLPDPVSARNARE